MSPGSPQPTVSPGGDLPEQPLKHALRSGRSERPASTAKSKHVLSLSLLLHFAQSDVDLCRAKREHLNGVRVRSCVLKASSMAPEAGSQPSLGSAGCSVLN